MQAVYAGSFDPPTLGHLDVILRVAPLFAKLHLVVAANPNKKSLFTADERIQLLNQSVSTHLEKQKFEVHKCDELLVNFCTKLKVQYLIRGMRALSDFEKEFQMASMNRHLNSKIETLHIMTDEKYFFISSSLIKEVAKFGGDLSQLVTPEVSKAIKKKFKETNK
jgi:pantetheine-phosphate adenylyltransferase